MSSIRMARAIRFKPVFLAVSLALTVGLAMVASACSSSDDNTSANTLGALNTLSAAGLHGIDTTIQSGTIPPTGQSVASHMQIVLQLTKWPSELKAPAAKMAGLMATMVTSLNSDKPDIAKAQAASAAAHAGYHEFSDLVWTYLGKQAGVKVADAPD